MEVLARPHDVFREVVLGRVPVAKMRVEPPIGWKILGLAKAQVPPIQLFHVLGISWYFSLQISPKTNFFLK